MKQSAKKQIVIIGCGNVAWHLAKLMVSTGSFTVSVYNHKTNKLLHKFKSELHCNTAVGFSNVPGTADYYFICVSDRAIPKVAAKLKIKNPNAIVMHTSGSASLEDLAEIKQTKAVFYPLQSFSASAEVNWKDVPILLEAPKKQIYLQLEELAGFFSKKILNVTYPERLKLHLAAVLVNNFTNSLYVAASDLLTGKKGGKLSFQLLHPLISQTTKKALLMDPREAQTGPAKRGDKQVMKKHLDLIDNNTELTKLYKQLSKLIKKQQR